MSEIASQPMSLVRCVPYGNRVMILPDPADDVSKGGILLPEQAKKRPLRGTIVEVGPGRMRDDGTFTQMRSKCGDRVMFSKYAGTEVEINDVVYLLFDEDSLLCRMQPMEAGN